ncbi:putative mitochondrial protein Fmp25 [Aspergillus clavatus NRRL 1]|uniref:Mitochondrial protein Fmp25, putative n=1 Tax=Aspergillus clavatus (strain ATCC 1007 / CBS 513.65 / DSM 816 / NCTC 3887 / NRRL 1 / QM 1276 / 107) TaxID=344612 RepID=A1CKL3_ASPCL|nr:mitochondrial protein Fmp25, putative [Aspergillus clavatus NRRL 1]EAW09687.1 mitochondrial protein Fmp25, putative [Aspergillus clavatus NRRL 1]
MSMNRLRQPVANFVTLSSRLPRTSRLVVRPWRRSYASSNNEASGPSSSSSSWLRNALGLGGTATAAFLAYTYVTAGGDLESAIEAKTKTTKIPGDLDSQYVHERRSLKSPGVFLWGTNAYRVVDPNSKETVIKAPRSFAYFDGEVLRDLKLGEKSGAAITEKGDLVQWGKGYSDTDFKPTRTLIGKDLTSVCMSNDRILALASNGSVYSLPIAKNDQESGRKPKESSWLPFQSFAAGVSYRLLEPALKLGEKVTAISGGLQHALLLTSSGRVFSVASSTESYPSFGQLGVPGLTWSTRPQGSVDACHEVKALGNSKITQIATGDYHSLALSKDGTVYAFGDNSFGQLGSEFDPASPFNDTPTPVPLKTLYPGNIWLPKVTTIAAGGANSFFTVDAQRILGPGEDRFAVRDLGRITADTWTCGRGIWGALGNGRWTHLQDVPTKVKTLSGLFEYNERTKALSPIRLREISVGTTHASAVLDNTAHVEASATSSLEKRDDWGYDALFWGGNENFQLGTGKRSNMSRPTHINAPPEPGAKDDKQEARLQIMPRHKAKVGSRTVSMEQRIECGRHISGIYSTV